MTEQSGDAAQARRAIVERVGIPLGEPGSPEDVAGLVEFLVSDRARYVRGTQPAVDGGAFPTV